MFATITPADFGKDHWSLLAYVETRVVDHAGYLDARHLRGDGEEYPTGLSRPVGGPARIVAGHSDYDCLADLLSAGWIVPAAGTTPSGRLLFRDLEARGKHFGTASARHGTHRYTLSTLGLQVSGALRAHKAQGGNFATFRWPLAA